MAVAHCGVSSCYNMMNWDFRWTCFCTLFGGMVLACLMKNSGSWWGCFILHTLWSNGGLLWYEMLHEELRLMMDFFFPHSQWILCDLLVLKFLVQDNNISKAAAASLQDQIWLGLWNAAAVFHSLKIDQFVCCLQVHQDMTAPLAHYFIYTGHNSYLTGNQLNSKCSVEPIKAALKQGVRAIELDLWPNSAKDDIQVLHGKYVALFPCKRDWSAFALLNVENFWDSIAASPDSKCDQSHWSVGFSV